MIQGFQLPGQAQQPDTQAQQQQACQAGHPSLHPETQKPGHEAQLPGTGQQQQAQQKPRIKQPDEVQPPIT